MDPFRIHQMHNSLDQINHMETNVCSDLVIQQGSGIYGQSDFETERVIVL